jgi:hypothetical protein
LDSVVPNEPEGWWEDIHTSDLPTNLRCVYCGEEIYEGTGYIVHELCAEAFKDSLIHEDDP